MLKRCYDYFNSNIEELLSKYNGEYIVIKDEAVIGHYDSFEEAYNKTCDKEEIGTFIIQHCIAETPEQTMHFAWNNVSFEHAVN